MQDAKIYQKENFLSPEECDFLTWMAECQDEWDSMPGTLFDNRTIDFFTTLQHRRYSSPALQRLSMQIYKKTQEFVSKSFGTEGNVAFMAIVRVLPGEEQVPHRFGADGSGVFAGCVTFLNDNFVGGISYYPNLGVEITPRLGFVYASGADEVHSHGIGDVTGAPRYSIVSTWTTDPMSDAMVERTTKLKEYLEACCSEEKPVVTP
ncbi:MAG: hypothetical protein EBW15_07925 [Actinobacteria bacterium]|jgi:hypothetical protein|nr:hypothetical protein [Actinomycetota bacterium]